MLVLTRRVNQSVMIGDDVLITVLEIHGDQVRIGIDAPRSLPLRRSPSSPVREDPSGPSEDFCFRLRRRAREPMRTGGHAHLLPVRSWAA